MSAHLVIKIVAFFCVLADVFAQSRSQFDYDIFPQFWDLNTTFQRITRLNYLLDADDDKRVTFEDLYDLFDRVDRDENGVISPSEVETQFDGSVPVWARSLFAFFDARDGSLNGTVTYRNFDIVWEQLDTNKNRTIEHGEFRQALNSTFRGIFQRSCPIATNEERYSYNFNSE